VNRRRHRRAFTLLEVLLALAILVGSLAVIGELGRLGLMNSRRASALAVAQLHCESKLAEITSGIVAPSAVVNAPLEVDPAWVYTVTVEPTPDLGLIAVRVTVAENLPPANRPAEFTLVRWMPETNLADEEAATGEASTAEAVP
jgi:prepilin-type N-terminal cleavage/methylation domain-containing protein